MISNVLSVRLVRRIALSFLAILLLAGIGYTGLTLKVSERYFDETTQRLHARLAQDLIDEKFVDAMPIDADGEVNKPLFGDIMHDMMAVNRAIEVYLLDEAGAVRYSVVLDGEAGTRRQEVDLNPIHRFLAEKGRGYVLGDDPREPGGKRIFSAARFERGGATGYVYIILAGQDFRSTRAGLLDSYVLRLGLGGSLLTLFLTAGLAVLAIWYLTRNLRELVHAAKRFQDGDLDYRIPDAEGSDIAGVTLTFNAMADTIRSDMKKIQGMERHRKELIANISHDLRTPLAVIQGYIETLQMKDGSLDSATRADYLTTIGTSGERLARLISQLFEYSRLDSEPIEPKMEPFAIADLINDVQRGYQVLAERKDIELSVEMEATPPLVFGDISLVERAVQNLMDNALKFTPNGGRVVLKAIPRDREVEIVVRDSGPGIPPEHQSLIFERYRRAKVGESNEGIGLGLAIVRKIMDLHGARIKIWSLPEEGTAFSFLLPVYQSQV